MGIVKTYKGHDVPEGATDYGPSCGVFKECFYKSEDGYWCSNLPSDNQWVSIGRNLSRGDVIGLPQEPGAYTPKVGEECELTPHNNIWGFDSTKPVNCIVVGLYLDWIVVAEENCAPTTTRLDKCDLAPIKTEREKVIEWARKQWLAFDGTKEKFDGYLFDIGALTIPDELK